MLPTTVSPLVMMCWVTTSSDMSLSCYEPLENWIEIVIAWSINSPSSRSSGRSSRNSFQWWWHVPCKASGYPPPTLTWSRYIQGRSIPIPTLFNLRVYQFNGTLGFFPISDEDSGTYTCTAINIADSKRCEVTVLCRCDHVAVMAILSSGISKLSLAIHLMHCLSFLWCITIPHFL